MTPRLPTPAFAKPQNGSALVAILLIAAAIASIYLVNLLSPLSQNLERQASTSARLAAAKDQLLAFNLGQSGDLRDPDKMSLGRLPLPDMGRRGISDPVMANDHEGESASVGLPGNATDTILIGRLPWKTLGAQPLRDESGECLWYGVSAAWKNTNNQNSTDPQRYAPPPYNWDTLGDFELYGADLQKISDNPHQNRAVAVIFAPGSPLPGQDRSPATPAVAGEFIEKCGGNYIASNYLDPAGLATAIASTGSRFNAFSNEVANTHVDYTADPAGRNAMSASPPALPKNILAQPVTVQSAGSTVAITNDRVLAITNDEIFARLLKQTHSTSVTAKINQTLQQLKTCLQTANIAGELPSTGLTTSGNKKVGKLDPAIACANAVELDRWRDNIWYAMIPKVNAPTKIKVCAALDPVTGRCLNPAPNTTECDGVLLFAGPRTPTQRRSTVTEKDHNHPENYLEAGLGLIQADATLDIAAPTSFGLPSINPTTDIAVCLTHPSAVSYAVNVADMKDLLATNGAGKTLLTRDVANNTITLGNPDALPGGFGSASAVACSWIDTPLNFGNGLRTYFKFKYQFYDPAVTNPVGSGFTFALIDAATNGNNVCGGSGPVGSTNRGQLLGYAGTMKDAAGSIVSAIAVPKMAVEFDTADNGDRNDFNNSHIAVVYWGQASDLDDDNKHGVPTTVQSITQRDPVNNTTSGKEPYPCLRQNLPTGCNDQLVLEREFHVRIDIERVYDSSFVDPGPPAVVLGKSNYRTRVWISQVKLTDMDTLGTDFVLQAATPAPQIDTQTDVFNTTAGVEAFKQIRFGFTVAQPSRLEKVLVTNLAVNSRP